MSASVEQLQEWLTAKEGERLEFKEAKNRYEFDELVQYCVALANEGGGKIILGVADKRPRLVVGTLAFSQPERTRNGLIDRLHLRIDFDEIAHPKGRVLVFHVPCRPVGTPVKDRGIYWMRKGDSLVPMSEERLRKIFAESGHDFSADVCSQATLADLDRPAIEEFRKRWILKSGNRALATLSDEQLLTDAEALVDGQPTYAALVLFGTHAGLGRYLAQAEITFEYRSSDASGPAQARKDYRIGFFRAYDDLWSTINLRNDLQHYQDGLFVLDIPTFAERPIREAILNAVSHRDYLLGGNVFIRQYPRRIEITSPGGFPHSINLDNILDRQSPRNRRIADLFTRCGLVERSGQGMNLIFEESIRQSKATPDFTGTDAYQVALTLHGTVQDPNFIRFLERIGQERVAGFSTHDFLILDLINRDRTVPEHCKVRLAYLLDQGIIDRVSQRKFVLSRQFYNFVGQKGVYTRKKGLDRATNKALLVKHIEDNRIDGSPIQDLLQVLPSLSRDQVKTLLKELKTEKKIYVAGTTRAGRWFPGSEPIGADERA
jgi:ATP-dependent DNA helicase RecG